MLLFPTLSFEQTTREWIGNGNWSNAANWSPSGNPAGARLLWNNTGTALSNNDQLASTYLRLQFSPLAGQIFTITGNQITLADAAARGTVLNESALQQNVLATVLFNDNSKPGLISTSSTGKLLLGDIIQGGNASSSIRFASELSDGSITVGGSITSSNSLIIGQDEAGTSKPSTRVFFTNNNALMTGLLRVNSGVLNLQNSGATGYSLSNMVEIIAGAAVELQGNISIDNNNGKRFKITGNGILNVSGAIRNISGNNALLTDVLISGNSRIASDANVLTLGNIGKHSGTGSFSITFSGAGDVVLTGTLGQIFLSGNPNISNLSKIGTGTLFVNNKCYYLGNTNINTGGKLTLGMTNALPVTSNLILNDGTLSTGSYSQEMGTLTLSGNSSTINLGTTGSPVLKFAASQGVAWTAGKLLTITGWDGEEGLTAYPGSAKIYVGTDVSGLTETQMAQIVFVRPNGVAFCQGASLLPDGELVPAKRPFITNVTGSQPHSNSLLSFSGYVGSTITITGCQFFGATSVMVGITNISGFAETGNNITFTLPDNASGIITVTTAGGSRSSSTSLTNLGYLAYTTPANAAGTTWNTASLWQGNTIPPGSRAVTIAFNSVIASGFNNLNGRSITISSGFQQTALRLSNNNLIPASTPLVLAGGTLRVMNASTNTNSSATGFSQTFVSLSVQSNSTIALDNRSSGTYGSLTFGSSRTLNWPSGATLTILNWAGSERTTGTKYRIYINPDGSGNPGLTDDQLRQIKFEPFCQGAFIMPDGELVPSGAPFIAGISALPGSSNFAYFGSTIRLTGCKFTDVNKVEVGSTNITPFSIINDSQLEFKYPEGLAINKIILTTPDLKIGISADSVKKLGYISETSGNWNSSSSWYGGFIPVSGEKITIANAITIDGPLGLTPDTVFINSGGQLEWSNSGSLTIAKALVVNSGGTVMPAQQGSLNIADNGSIVNNGTFNGNGVLTTNFMGNGTISGSMPATFHNLTINSGIVTLPLNVGVNPPLPLITNEFRVNGGSLATTLNTNVGPRYGPNSSLVYSSGLYQRRFREWLGSPGTNQSAGVPYNVIIENGTELVLDGQTSGLGDPQRLRCLGNFIVKNGSVRVDLPVPLEITGNLQLGNSLSEVGVLNMGRISASEDPNFPTSRPDFGENYLVLQGSFIRYQNSSFNYRSNRQPIRFEGNNAAVIDYPGVTVPAGDTAQGFYSIILNKNADLTLNQSIGIRDSIVFTLGRIIAPVSGFVRIEAGGKSSGGNDQSFISGQVRKVTANSSANASGDFIFPVGKGNLYRPVQIGQLSHNGSTVYAAEYFNSSTTSGGSFSSPPVFLDAFLLGIWQDQWWQVDRASGAGTARVGIPYSTGQNWTLPPCSTCRVGVVRFNGSGWEFTKDEFSFQDTTFTYAESLPNNYSRTVFSGVLNGFSPFTIGFGYERVLPIRLIQFGAQENNADALLNWRIAESGHGGHFEIEHSKDGRNFSLIGKVFDQHSKELSFLHKQPGAGRHYYRLVMVEKDGFKNFSRVELLQLGQKQTVVLGIIKNPVSSGITEVRVFSAKAQQAHAILYDFSGRRILSAGVFLTAGENKVSLPFFLPGRGVYQLVFRTSDGVEKTMPVLK